MIFCISNLPFAILLARGVQKSCENFKNHLRENGTTASPKWENKCFYCHTELLHRHKFDVIKRDVITALDIKIFSTCCQRYTVEREILYKM